ncbi:transcriptional regulator PtsJ [Trinickia fusca]|uniref:Transcriptional regulator PtsJ n=1 Tax=Trinickia fusca TaxID=2419777 RepID=A0A494XL24_9BURK|nr:transcriptional regulator PtsJ [Trinickia fusca]RKP48233.1 transcriptional regulator PtsJ [Trinickia fusca]
MKIVGKTAAEIFDSVRTLAQSGQLGPGQALPPVRDLAASLDVNRNTVAAAYKRLVTAGIAVTQGRLGTVIRQREAPGEQEGSLPDSPLTDLAGGNPNPAWLPDPVAALSQRPGRPRLYGEAPVNPELEDYARRWLAADCPDEFEVDVTHGAVDAIERLLAGHLVAGDKVAVESPCFLTSINTVRIAGLQPIGVPVDGEGIRADALEAALSKGAQAVIVTPRAHNPTGCNLSEARAKALRRVLARHPNVLVIIDDHFALLTDSAYRSIVPPSTQRWALIRSVSKALGPDLRLALVASDRRTSQRLRLRLAPGTSWVSHLLQDIVCACLSSRKVMQRLADAKLDYANRRAWLVDALHEQGLAALVPADGLNLWVPLSHDGQAVVLGLARRGWLVRNGEVFCVQDIWQGMRVTISNLDQAGARRLAQDIRRSLDELASAEARVG